LPASLRPTRPWSLPLQSKSRFSIDMSDAEAQTVMDDILIAARLAQRSKHDRYRTQATCEASRQSSVFMLTRRAAALAAMRPTSLSQSEEVTKFECQ